MGLRRVSALSVLIFAVALCSGCGGRSTTTSSSSNTGPVIVTISPVQSTLDQGATIQFLASVVNSTNVAVTWTIQEGAAGGSITSTGFYTAPKAAGTFHIVVTSQADSTKTATAAVAVNPISIYLNPSSVTMSPGENITFTAGVVGTINRSFSWSIMEGAAGGTITSTGTYTAPNTNGTFHIVVTAAADNTKTAIATVVTGPVTVSISPATDVLGPAGVRAFTAAVSNTVNLAVNWSVQEGAAGGTITAAGQYTAPKTTGTAHVVATSAKDPTKSAVATVTLVASGFTATGAMVNGRSAHTATLLKNGKVLIAGGNNCFFSYYYYSCSGDLAASELYDPSTGTFTATGNMTARRSFHTATLLADGRVLIAGGTSGSGTSAELYDPTSGTFTTTGTMTVARRQHTATLLPNGKVLLAGGTSVSGTLASAELYDPAAGTFSTTGAMGSPRYGHTATLLSTGKVLVAGGYSGSSTLATAELYDPTSNSFSPTGSLTAARTGHVAVLLSNGTALLVAGSNSTATLAAEIYDPSKASFTATGSLAFARATPLAIRLTNGTVLVLGGTSVTAEIFDPVAGSFSQTGGPFVDHQDGAIVLLADGRVLVTGGAGANDSIDTNIAEIFK